MMRSANQEVMRTMRKTIYVLILISFFSSRRAYSKDEEEVLNVLGILIVTGLIAGTVRTFYLLNDYKHELSDDRAKNQFLLEYGFRPNAEHYGAGFFLNDDQIIHARYTHTGTEPSQIDFRGYEVGFRHYLKILYGELNIFHFDYQPPERSVPTASGGSLPYTSPTYETTGISISLGLSLQKGPFTFGAISTFHRGILSRTTHIPTNATNMSERSIDEDLGIFRRRIISYFQLGFSF